uniref:Small integral membrane protein 14 n=1 Tax=Corethrella appendiculata TaxID=1370023 RepID=U5EMY2_9DIPT
MGDEFDACACIWNHELAMRRLLSILRNGQAYCTDNECFDTVVPSPQSIGSDFGLMMVISIFAMLLYMFRPTSLRNRNRALDDSKQPPSNGPNDDGPGGPPLVG